jgi:hypothetical protein
MQNLYKFFYLIGILLIIIGFFLQFGQKIIPLGKLPGDIAIEKKNFAFYFPLTTSILISVILTLIGLIIRWINKN